MADKIDDEDKNATDDSDGSGEEEVGEEVEVEEEDHLLNAIRFDLHEDVDLGGNHSKKITEGFSYSGNFERGLISGYGKMIWSDDSLYIGQWKNNQRHGEGTFYFPTSNSKASIEGIWFQNDVAFFKRIQWNTGDKDHVDLEEPLNG